MLPVPSSEMPSSPLPAPPSESESTTTNFWIQNREVRTIVIQSNKSDGFTSLNERRSASLSELLSSVPNNGVVALDIQNHYHHPNLWSSTESPVAGNAAALTLCAGRFCVVIHLYRIDFTPPLLANFLDRADLSFAGVGIRTSLEALLREYGLTSRNAVELGWLAASLKGKPHLEAFGLAALAEEAGVGDVSFKMSADPGFADWSVDRLSAEQLEAAANQAFLTFRVANQLLGGGYQDGTSDSDPDLMGFDLVGI